ncbi:N-formylglutamate amidohydrolase [Puniceibacterium antarcticum]|uniref:N-formylglutamate amidohydrolase n=1 Tax=Puniceibacterium antarcticum TaxID=1206336 RepID=A0A2G8R3X3_9RHOB|nr:N-formylglutamate deformylase [Puniceibacterium antarcticum]PIL16255.1 N-formylglutamate amidohydrolase [Puniceibacterium antarcticum]
MHPVTVTRGDSPLVLGFPHTGTYVPDDIRARLNPEGRMLRDTDWHIDSLYRDLIPGITCVAANFHRYVIDANRDPDGASLYPGQTTTGLVPLNTFDNTPIWAEGAEPTEADIAQRLADWHRPYHAALEAELARVKARHGIAILYDCHSIRSVIPWLFDGTLPDFNIGSDSGATCAPALEQAVLKRCTASGRTTILNGRFRGGWTTRHYATPATGIHTIQMELAQSSHLARETPDFALDPDKSDSLRAVLKPILQDLIDLAPTLA